MDCSSDFAYTVVTASTKSENILVLLRALHKGFQMEFLVEDVIRFKRGMPNSKFPSFHSLTLRLLGLAEIQV